MIKGFLAIDNGSGDCVVRYFDHETMMHKPALLKREYDLFLEDADDFARANLFKGTHVAYGIFLAEDDAIHDIQREQTSIIYNNHHKLIDDFERHYREKEGVFMRIAEKITLGTLNNPLDMVNNINHT